MKNQESAAAGGRIFLGRRRSTKSRFGMPESWKYAWRRMLETCKQRPKLFARAAVAALIAWTLFDFVSFSFGSLPATPSAIQVTGTRRVTEDQVRTEIFRKLRARNAENLIEVRLDEVADHLLRQIPAIRSSTITLNVGRGIMTVAVEERLAIGGVRTPTAFLEFDKDGMLFPARFQPGGQRPKLEVLGLAGENMAPGRNISEHPAGAGLLRVLHAFPAALAGRIMLVRIIRPEYFELVFDAGIGRTADARTEVLRDNPVLVKIDPATFPDKIDQLTRLIRKDEKRSVSYVDLRFRQDVIAYAPPQRTRPKEKSAR